ncbi:MAG TPA: hypothetical protein VEK07_23350 [Polyangiaceae bacterium]|nr:hypothetical protein [Polyangiaceae bacterium]
MESGKTRSNVRSNVRKAIVASGVWALPWTWLSACSTVLGIGDWTGLTVDAAAPSTVSNGSGSSVPSSASSAGSNIGSSASSAGSNMGSSASSSGLNDISSASSAGSNTGSSASGSVPSDPDLLIDDQMAYTGSALSAGTDLLALIPTNDVIGTWYTYGWDAAAGATLTPAQGTPFAFKSIASGTPPEAACLASTGYFGFSAGEGLNFATTTIDAGSNPVPIDISSFTGITFLAMSSSSTNIEVRFPDDQTDGNDPTAVCQDAGANQSACNDDFNTVVALTPNWTWFTVPFSGLVQSSFGALFANGIDLHNVFGIQFEDEGSGMADGGPTTFQFCIADIYFTQ